MYHCYVCIYIYIYILYIYISYVYCIYLHPYRMSRGFTTIPRTMSQTLSYVCIFGAVLRASTPPMGVAAQRSCYLCKQSQMQWKHLAARGVSVWVMTCNDQRLGLKANHLGFVETKVELHRQQKIANQ